jgi:hypothetical protein
MLDQGKPRIMCVLENSRLCGVKRDGMFNQQKPRKRSISILPYQANRKAVGVTYVSFIVKTKGAVMCLFPFTVQHTTP